MTQPLNGPLEVGIRSLFLLLRSYPAELGLNRLVLLDHALLHTGDFEGPVSLLPDLPNREGEIAVKRQLVTDGLRLLVQAGLAQIIARSDGIVFRASEDAHSFSRLLESDHALDLLDRSGWVLAHFDDLDDHSIQAQISATPHRREERPARRKVHKKRDRR